MKITAGLVLLVIAVILFVLAAFDVAVAGLDLTNLGLAFFAGAFLADRLMPGTT